jgi:hypothetical protein
LEADGILDLHIEHVPDSVDDLLYRVGPPPEQIDVTGHSSVLPSPGQGHDTALEDEALRVR